MNTVAVLEGINHILGGVDEQYMTIAIHSYIGLKNLKSHLEDAIRTEMASAAGTKQAQAAFKRLMDLAKNECREQLAYPWIDNDGMQVVCDGYRAYRYKNHLPLEERPEGLDHPEVSDKIIKDASCHRGEELALPDRKAVKAHIAIKHAERTTRKKQAVVWDFGDGRPAVNAEFLLDMLTVFPDAKAYVYDSKPELGPIFFESHYGDGVLLPRNKKA